jgi:hypothetical protein
MNNEGILYGWEMARKSKKGSYIVTSGDIVTEASKEFANLKNYEESGLVGKDVNEVFKTIRIRGLDRLTQPNTSISSFVFTKELMVRFVEITYMNLEASGDKVYFIEEIPNSRLEDKFPFFYKLLSDNRSGLAVYSANELILFQTNQFYLDFLDCPFNKRENTIGLRRSEIFEYWPGSPLEAIFNKVVATGETHNESEFMNLNFFERGTTYWQFSLTPFSENGKGKYIFFYVNDVTETVRTNQTLRRQKEEIKAIMDNISMQSLL